MMETDDVDEPDWLAEETEAPSKKKVLPAEETEFPKDKTEGHTFQMPFNRKQRAELMCAVAPSFVAGAFDGDGRQMKANDDIVRDIAQFTGMLLSRDADYLALWSSFNFERAANEASLENRRAQVGVTNLRLAEKQEEAEILKKAFPRDDK